MIGLNVLIRLLMWSPDEEYPAEVDDDELVTDAGVPSTLLDVFDWPRWMSLVSFEDAGLEVKLL